MGVPQALRLKRAHTRPRTRGILTLAHDGLPHSIEAEIEVLGTVMVHPSMARDLVASGLEPKDFYWERHQLVCGAMLALARDGVDVDEVTLREQLVTDGVWGRSGSERTLGELLSKASLPSNFNFMCQRVKHYSISREVVVHGWDVTKMGLEAGEPSEMLEKAHQGLREIAHRGNLRVGVGMGDGLRDYMEYVTKVMEGDITDTRLPTGIGILDSHLGGGFRTGWQVVVMSSAGHGKTAISINNFALSAAKAGHPVLICSLEMQPKEVIGRMVACESGVPAHVHDRFGLDPLDYSRMVGAADVIRTLPIRIIGAQHGSLDGVVSIARQMKVEYGRLGMVVVDYLQLMKSPSEDVAQGDERAISTNSGGLKLMANELDCVSVLISQPILAAKRDRKRPTIQQAKGSGSIEDDADIALIPWLPATVDEELKRVDPALGQPAEIGMDKFRHGPRRNLGEEDIKWNPRYMRFEEV